MRGDTPVRRARARRVSSSSRSRLAASNAGRLAQNAETFADQLSVALVAISEGKVEPVDEQQALAWYETNPELWAVVAPPWVLVQLRTGQAPVA